MSQTTFTRPGGDGLTYTVSDYGRPATNTDAALVSHVLVRDVRVVFSGAPFGDYSLKIQIPGQYLVWATGENFSFRELSAREVLAKYGHRWCDIKRAPDKVKKQNGGTITVPAAQALRSLNELRYLNEVFDYFTKRRQTANWASRAFFGWQSWSRIRDGNYVLIIKGQPATGARTFTDEAFLPAVAVDYPEHVFNIERTLYRKKTVVSVPGKQLLTTEGQFRRLSEVFEEIFKLRVQAKTNFQPADIPWRICFQLAALPSLDSGGDDSQSEWRLQILFQSVKDLSLLVPSLRDTTGYNANEYVRMLEKAALKFPLMDRWLKQGKPQNIALTFDEFVHFLETDGPELERAGFGIRFPSWMHEGHSTKRLSLVAHASEISEHQPGHLTLASVMQVNWRLCLDDDGLSPEEIDAIARLKMPLLKMRGKWVYVSAEEIQAVARLVREGFEGRFSAQEIVRLAADGKNADGLPVCEVVATGPWKGVLETLAGSISFKELAQPAGLKATLRPYQRRGFSWLVFMAETSMGACLADDMGLGKTVQTLAFLQHRWDRGERQPALLVCPTSLMENWRREARQFTPQLRASAHYGQDRATELGEFFHRFQEHAMVITSYGLLARDTDLLREINWSGVILDEAQNIKNPDTQQARTARSLTAAYRIALTGTPVENTVADLWSIMEFLNPGYLGTRKEFERRYVSPLQQEDAKATTGGLKRLTRPFLLRRLKTQPDVCPDLPDKLESKEFCPLTREQATLYATVLRGEWDAIARGNGGQRSIAILRLIGHLKQVCNHPVQYLKDRSQLSERSGKLERLAEILDEVRAAGKAALVFTQYREMGDLLREHLCTIFGEREVMFLHGATSMEDRKKMNDSFQTKDGPAIFIRSLKAGGTGVTLTRATHVIHFDRWWNPAVENQATDRAHRIGQQEKVHVHKLICAGTLEDRIDQMIERKNTMAGQVIDAGDRWLVDLSTDDIRELVALDDEMIID